MSERVGLWDLLAGVIVLALVYMLVRPGSKGTVLITAIGDALMNLVGSVTGFNDTGGAGA